MRKPYRHNWARLSVRLSIRRIRVVVGLAATTLNIVAIVYFLRWVGQTDFMFGHREGPPSYILTAFWLALIGVIATAAWFLIGLHRKLIARKSTQEKSAFSGWMWFQGITLIVLLLPACLTVWCGAAKLPDARIKSQIERMKSEAATSAELIEGLKSPEGRVRHAAARTLGLTEDRSAVEPLISCLGDQDAMVRISAAQALARIADPRAMAPLMEALEDESYSVRVWAASGLATIGDASCIPVLKELADMDPKNRTRLERAIEAIRKREDAQPVCP
ncbi:MAG: HEAT repeat domain-containing protein [Phycisphaerales bacterium]|nr:MAG: HEAT repeat domain-containing protein [Phycisphaerales bacterium]